jgi:hypothetical protein
MWDATAGRAAAGGISGGKDAAAAPLLRLFGLAKCSVRCFHAKSSDVSDLWSSAGGEIKASSAPRADRTKKE